MSNISQNHRISSDQLNYKPPSSQTTKQPNTTLPQSILSILYTIFPCINKSKNDPFSFLRKVTNISDPMIARWMYAERYMNGETETHKPYALYTEVNQPFRPKSQTSAIALPCFLLNKNQVTIYAASPSPEVAQTIIKKSHVLFPIHPDMLENGKLPYLQELEKTKKVAPLYAVPSSSSRTVLPLKQSHPYPCYLKLDYRNVIGQFKRSLSTNIIEHAVNVSRILELVKYEKFGYLPESIGISLNERKGGLLIRETTPRPIAKDKRQLLPLFTLYGKDYFHPNEKPLLVQLINKSGKDPKSYILENVLFPLITCFVEAYKQQGILLSCHGQNMLVELNEKLEITRFISRDFDNHIDKEWRKQNGLPDLFQNEKSASKEVRSLMYDNALGRAVLDYLASLMEKEYGIPAEELREPCRKLFQLHLGNFDFPPETYRYSKSKNSDEYSIISRNEPPTWRPILTSTD